MNNLNLKACGVSEMTDLEVRETNGGIFPLVILGVVITAKAAAWIAAGTVAAAAFAAGVYVGYTDAVE